MGYCCFCSATYYSCHPSCTECYTGANNVISSVKQLHGTLESSGRIGNVSSNNIKLSNSSQVVSNCSTRINEWKEEAEEQKSKIARLEELAEEQKYKIARLEELAEEQKDKIAYLGEVVNGFKEQIQTDIQLLPSDDGSPISTHSALLATRSIIFKNMFDSDECMSASNRSIPFPELSHDELEILVEFLYNGQLSEEKLEKHVYALSNAAHKYEIPFLVKVCEKQLIKSLNSNNALEALEISNTCLMHRLKELAIDIIVKSLGDIVDSAKYEAFACSNPELNLAVMKAFVHRQSA